MGIQTLCFTVQQPIDFIKFSLPKKFAEFNLFLCPEEYNDVLMLRMEHFSEIQQKIKGSKITSD
jgi:hypothetical protein